METEGMEKKTKVPKLRFPGFTEDWEQCKFGDENDLVTGYPFESDKFSDDGIKLVRGMNVKRGYLDFSEDICMKWNSSLGLENYLLSDNDILIQMDGALIGKSYAKIKENQLPALLVQRVTRARTKKEKADSDFMYQTIQRDFLTYIGINKTETADPHLSLNDIRNFSIMVPKLEEQKRIGEYFSHIDHLITLHQRKLIHLQAKKKSLLQKMFPRKGERFPELRFPGFTDAWEQCKFGDMVIIERGGSPRPIEKFITNDENGLNWVKIGDAPERGNYITETKEKIKPEGLKKTREVHPGDLILSNSMSFGRPYIMAIDGCIHDGWLLIRDTNKVFDLKYLCQMLGTDQMLAQYKAMAAGSTVNNLNKELVGNTDVKIPNIEEQVKIGEYFSTLDNLITLHQRKLTHLQKQKKALLQQMFV